MSKVEQFKQFFKEVRMETKKVTFPSRKDTVATTMVVIAVVIMIGIYLGVVDFALSKIIGLALN
ncbi:MAG: preprotein translocase subunit SecE [Nitrospinae bacterium]|nr:preprotein translocase subunit SecE [Nitrospinota bacterium]